MNRRRMLALLVALYTGLVWRAKLVKAAYSFETKASIYGPNFYTRNNKTADGQWFDEFYGPRLVGIAHRTLKLGTQVAVEIPPQPDAWGDGLRLVGALIWCRVVDRGPYVFDAGETPRTDGRDVDLTMALLRHARWFDPSTPLTKAAELQPARDWGVRQVRIHVFE